MHDETLDAFRLSWRAQGEALERQPMDVDATQRCAVFSRHGAGALPRLARALSLSAPRASLEAPLQELATTLDFSEPLASLQVWSLCVRRCIWVM